MTREIKFRAWDKEHLTMWFNAQNAYDTIHHHSEDNSKGIDECLWGDCFQDVIENPQYIVMQFTGLLDKNGKEIYEGDIVSIHNGSEGEVVCSVEWDESYWLFRRANDKETWPFYYWRNNDEAFIEVIGNIHENPKLLRKI